MERKKKFFQGMYDYYEEILRKAGEKDIIIWGYGKGGAFCECRLKELNPNVRIPYYIDEFLYFPNMADLNIYRSSLLDYIDSSRYVVLLTMWESEKAQKKMRARGYRKGETYFDVRRDIGGNYLEYLQSVNPEIDFRPVTHLQRPNQFTGNYHDSTPFDFCAVDKVFEKIRALDTEKSFFDMGCGKGQIVLMAYLYGMDVVGGVEFLEDIYETAGKNMALLNIEADIYLGDAAGFQDIDRYSIFFFYNSFSGDILREVLKNIKNSYNRRRRRIYFIYANPYEHKMLMQEGYRLYTQLKVDCYDPLLNIYQYGNEI
ncbi:MAG: hypothetical protein NC081_02835 [Roseburia sp.]|nr:hypothetical protein [Roseburia sp.]